METCILEHYPFRCVLRFDPLIKQWEKRIAEDGSERSRYLERIRQRLLETPDLCGPTSDLSVLHSHEELIGEVMRTVFPDTRWETDLLVAMVPFAMQPVYYSPEFERRFIDENARFDEKRFDGDGAYNTGREIVRSRIDKATVRGSRERLTQPGMIAIVYSRLDEWREIVKHIEFLHNETFLKGETESFELEDLPHVQGLRALRVTVNLESARLAERAVAHGRLGSSGDSEFKERDRRIM